MVRVWIDKVQNKIAVQSDDLSVRYLFEVKTRSYGFIPWSKTHGWIEKTHRIYDGKPIKEGPLVTYFLGLGWAAYIVNVLRPYITEADYQGVLRAVISDTHRTVPFPELRDYQNEDVLHLLKYKTGLFGCYTSYGADNQVLINIIYENKNC